MNIPHKYLINNGLSESKKKFYEKLTSSYKRAYSEYRKKNMTDFNKKVINWLFSQNEETRMILCSVENKKYTNTIHEAFTYYEQNSKDIKFIITDEDDLDGEKFKLEKTSFYEYTTHENNNNTNSDCNNINQGKNNFEKISNSFLDNIVFYQCESPVDDFNNYSDYFTLDPEFFNNEEIFRNKCNELSDNHFLSSPIMTKKEVQSKANILSFELPNWISNDNHENNEENYYKKKYFSLAQYMLALIEQVLSIRYLLYYESKNLKDIVSSTYLYDLFNKKELILSHLNNIGIKPKMFSIQFKIADITTKIFYDKNIEEFIKEKKNNKIEYDFFKGKDNLEYYQRYNIESEEIIENLMEKYKNDTFNFNKSILNI